MNIFFICEVIKEKVKTSLLENVWLAICKISAILKKNVVDHNFVTNCDINTNIFLTISTLQILFDKSISNRVYFKNGV